MTAKELCPPLLYRWLARTRWAVRNMLRRDHGRGDAQELDVYWSSSFAKQVDTWGDGTVWDEIQMLLFAARGSVLDIACGTAAAMARVAALSNLDCHGCDISDHLISVAAGQSQGSKLVRCDATRLPYLDGSFDYAYSIGSLEHFTRDGIELAVAESGRVTRRAAFHMVPVSRSGQDEGWIQRDQGLFNNSSTWWKAVFERHFERVVELNSRWQDSSSRGRWYLCTKRKESAPSLHSRDDAPSRGGASPGPA